MKRIRIAMLAIGLSALTAGAQVSWNLNVGSAGANFNVGTPAYYYYGTPVLAMPAPVYYYGNGHNYNKHMKKARKYAKKAAKEYRKAGYYNMALHGPGYVVPAPPKHKKGHKHH